MMSHFIEEVHAIKRCTEVIWIPYIMHLIVIQLQRQSSSGFLVDFQVSKTLAQFIFFHRKDRVMILVSMHPMFRVSIDFCDHSSSYFA